MADLLHTHDLRSELLAQLCCCGLDLNDHLRDALPNLSYGQVAPAGQRRELQLVRRHEVAAFDGLDRGPAAKRLSLCLPMDLILEGAVIPHAGHRLAVDQCLGAVQALPVSNPSDQVLLDGVGENVAEALDRLAVEDPAMQLSGDVLDLGRGTVTSEVSCFPESACRLRTSWVDARS